MRRKKQICVQTSNAKTSYGGRSLSWFRGNADFKIVYSNSTPSVDSNIVADSCIDMTLTGAVSVFLVTD